MNNTCCNNSKEFNLAAKIAYSTWFGLAALATLVGNTVVLWLIARNRSLRTISNLFLTSLAAADLLVGLVIDPVWIFIRCLFFDTDTYWQTYSVYSKAIDCLWIHTTVATTFNLCCVTLDRHIAIFYPLRYEDIVTNRRCYEIIATVWFISLLLPFSRFLVKNTDHSMISTLWLSFTIITVLVPMIVIIYCSIRNLKAAAVQSKNIVGSILQNQDSVKRRKKNFKAAKTVTIVVGLFVVCWLPSLVTSFVQNFIGSVHVINLFTVWTPIEALAFTSSAINPCVYCFRNEDFYEPLTRTFRCLRRRDSRKNIRIQCFIKKYKRVRELTQYM